uniref:Integrase catalytic domain-containing protein n=1 Tax=Haemonchus contortus TaxID=6289 RepID=A0A7I4Y6K3_HAECO
MSLSRPELATPKQRLTRHLHDVKDIISDCEKFKEGWQFPSNRKELYIFIRTQRNLVTNIITKLEKKLDSISEIYDGTLSKLDTESETASQFQKYWNEKEGDETLECARELIQSLELRVDELDIQRMRISYSEEFDNIERQRTNDPTGNQRLTQQSPSLSPIIDSDNPSTSQNISAHWYRKELRIPEFFGDPTQFEQFWEIFSELVHKQPYSEIEKLTILLDKCKGEAARALKFLPRKGSSYQDAVKQLHDQFHNEELNVKLLLEQLDRIPQSSENASQLRATVNDIMAIIAPLSRFEGHIDALEYKAKVRRKFPASIQRKLLSKEYDDSNVWSMDTLISEIRKIVKKYEITQVHTEHSTTNTPQTTTLYNQASTSPRYCCAACSGSHKIRYCNRYKSVESKRQRIQDLNKCFKCFSTEHYSSQCKKTQCRRCGGQHNISLCRKFRAESLSPYRDRNPTDPRHKSRVQSTSRSTRERNSSKSSQHSSSNNSGSHSSSRSRHRSVPDSSKSSGIRSRSQTPHPRRSTMVNTAISDTADSGSSDNDDEEIVFIHRTDVSSSDFSSRLMIIPVAIYNPSSRRKESVYALIDTGSSKSFISYSLVERLGLSSSSHSSYILTTFGGKQEKRKSQKYNTSLIDLCGHEVGMNLLSVEIISHPIILPRLSLSDISYACQNLRAKCLLNDKDIELSPDILIGIDYYNNIMDVNETPLQLPSGLQAIPTIFGYVVTGMVCHSQDSKFDQINPHCYMTILPHQESIPDITTMWKLEGIGITDDIVDEDENKKILQEFYDTVEIRNNQIYVRFPWKPNEMELDNNYKLALSRLHQLYNSLQSKPAIWSQYCQIIQEQLHSNIIEEVPEEVSSSCPTYYIPHQAVVKPSSATTKVRIVLDASSKRIGQLSLNDVLYQGPTILPSLLGILIRLRFGNFLIAGDVEKAFHMIHLQESQRDATRFLWLKNPKHSPSSSNIRKMRFTRVPFGTKASPSLLAMSIKYFLERNHHEKLCNEISRNLYVDNVILLADTIEEAVDKYRKSKDIFRGMSMNLREFVTNDLNVKRQILEKDRSHSVNLKVLGVPWDTSNDILVLKSQLPPYRTLTKRNILRIVHSTFDPLGLLIPLLIPARIFLQSLWLKNYEWDQPLADSEVEVWNEIARNTEEFEKTIPRKLGILREHGVYEICTFADASTNAYAACTYIRHVSDFSTETSILCAKYRLAPVSQLTSTKTGTIPKLELLALLIASQLTDFVRKELDIPISSIRIFSDSKIALHQVHSGKNAGTFVNIRVKKIRSLSTSWNNANIDTSFYYVNSTENPADCATRGVDKTNFQNHFWWHGPKFLLENENTWTQTEIFKMKGNDAEVAVQLCIERAPEYSQVFRFSLSDFNKLKRSAATVLKFIRKVGNHRYCKTSQVEQGSQGKEICEISDSKEINAKDLIIAERALLRDHYLGISEKQRKTFGHLKLISDNGIYRCQGRLANSHLGFDAMNPILLVPNHALTKIIVMHVHKKSGHQGVAGTLAELQTKYWLPKGRQVVKKIIRECVTCIKAQGAPYQYPPAPALPSERVSISRPFENIGLDYAGPFLVRTEGNQHEKRWICLYTCMATRAIHLETVKGLSAKEFVNAFRRFIARRGTPRTMLSDNATTFTAGNDLLRTIFDELQTSDEFSNFNSQHGITWNFITPLSPWKGGFYERLIGSLKSCLRKTIQKKFLSDEEFCTVVTECEALVNSRPLTYVSSDFQEGNPIRPIDFLHPHAKISMWNFEPDYDPNFRLISNRNEAIQLLEETKESLAKFWRAWSHTYLTTLQNFHLEESRRRSRKLEPVVGSIVL